VCVTAGYVATGSDDCFLRLWPLDFNDFLMEAEHESAVTSISVSDDALKLLVGTESRTMGILDVCTHSYTTTMRSHFGSIIAVAHDSGRNDEFATVSKDRTIRVWDIETGNQKYEFASPGEYPPQSLTRPSCAACLIMDGCVCG
jgi:WD40 repeat protein